MFAFVKEYHSLKEIISEIFKDVITDYPVFVIGDSLYLELDDSRKIRVNLLENTEEIITKFEAVCFSLYDKRRGILNLETVRFDKTFTVEDDKTYLKKIAEISGPSGSHYIWQEEPSEDEFSSIQLHLKNYIDLWK